MKCVEAGELFTEVAGGELDGALADEVRAHAAGCDACGAQLAELEATIGLMRRAGSEPLPQGFALALHQKLVAAGTPRRSLGDRLRAAIALQPVTWAACAAGLAAVLSVGGTLAITHRAQPVQAQMAAYKVPESKVALVKIEFVADRTIDDVAFEITLPDGLRFVSGGEQMAERTFRFEGKLNAGSNSIPIAVKGPRAGRYTVIAHAIGADVDVTQQVVLEVTT
jgi:anti-sigma factor RsiW